ncbi:MAG: hypothetical protein R2749_08505 [Acidimicrobiales bacterium]
MALGKVGAPSTVDQPMWSVCRWVYSTSVMSPAPRPIEARFSSILPPAMPMTVASPRPESTRMLRSPVRTRNAPMVKGSMPSASSRSWCWAHISGVLLRKVFVGWNRPSPSITPVSWMSPTIVVEVLIAAAL